MHLLLDLDGTLIDSRPGIIATIQHALAENGLAVPAAEDLSWCVGPPLLETIRKLVGPDSPELFESTVRSYRERYSTTTIYQSPVYQGMVDALVEMRGMGHTLHVATSKAEIFAKRIIDHFGLEKHFVSVNGSGLDGTRGDKAELIAHILGQQGIAPSDAVMIGDREHDVTGARKNGVPAIGVLWGYGSGAELMRAGAIATVRVPQILPEALDAVR